MMIKMMNDDDDDDHGDDDNNDDNDDDNDDINDDVLRVVDKDESSVKYIVESKIF